MYFELDREDFIFDKNHEKLYRLIATENFKTISPESDDMIRNILTIKKGEKGGYVGSDFCLEEKFYYKLKPWVFYGSQLSAGCILSGCSILTGASVVLDESIIEGANVIKDSTIINSTISTDDYKQKGGNRVLLATYVYRNSKIEDTVIKVNNVAIRNSILTTCDIIEGYGNIRLKNTEMENIVIPHNVAVYDCDVKCEAMASLKSNMTYTGTDVIEGIPENITVKVNSRLRTHESVYNEWPGAKISSSGVGIYRNVDYDPTQYN